MRCCSALFFCAVSAVSHMYSSPFLFLFRSAYSTAASAKAGKQDFLEASPYWDQSTVPVNTYKNKSPFTSKVISVKRIVGPEVRLHTLN